MEHKKEQPKKAEISGERITKETAACESCMYYDTDNDDCRIALDEDEFFRFSLKKTGDCPYYKFYDEYKSVRKQN